MIADAPRISGGYGKTGLSMITSVFGEFGVVSGTYYLVTRLNADETNLLPQHTRLRAVVTSLKLPKDVTVRVGGHYLGLENPEGLRDALRRRIAEHIKQDRSLVLSVASKAEFTLNGLDGPLKFTRMDERHIAVWLPFKVSHNSD